MPIYPYERESNKLTAWKKFLNGGKKRTIVKRKRKRVEDGISDEEEDPYTLINIEGKNMEMILRPWTDTRCVLYRHSKSY